MTTPTTSKSNKDMQKERVGIENYILININKNYKYLYYIMFFDVRRMVKRCINCGKTKDLKYFKKDKRNKDGYANICKRCHMQRYYTREYNRKKRGSIHYKKVCIVCGKTFWSWYPITKTCSKGCSRELGRKTSKRNYWKHHPPVRVICRVCGKSFISGKNGRIFCSKKCRKKKKHYVNKKNGRVYFRLIEKYDIVDKKVRMAFIDHHINNFCTVPIPVVPHFNSNCKVDEHRKKMIEWVLKLWVSDFDELIKSCL